MNPFKKAWNRIKTGIQGFSNTTRFSSTVLSNTFISVEIARKSVEQIYLAYFNLLKYGCSGVQSAIAYRRSWIIGTETSVTSSNKDTQAWIDEFNAYNQIPIFNSQCATYGEIEGKVLMYLMVEKDDDGNTRIVPRILPFHRYIYEVKRDENDKVISVSYMMKNEKQELDENRIIYNNLSLIPNYENYDLSVPAIGYVIEDIIILDKLLEYWKTVNEKYSKTTPVFLTEEWSDAVRIAQIIKGKTDMANSETSIDSQQKWKVGDGLAIKGDVKLLEFNMDGIKSLQDEITARSRKISGQLGIPLHMMGFPDLLSNRSTAQEMAEQIAVKTRTERLMWEVKLKELYQKSIKLYNKVTGSAIDWQDIKVTIPVSSQNEVRNIMEYGEKLLTMGVISKQTYREMIPGVDHQLELKRLAEERAATAQEMSDAMAGSSLLAGLE